MAEGEFDVIWDGAVVDACGGGRLGTAGPFLADTSVEDLQAHLVALDRPVNLDGRGVRFPKGSLAKLLEALPLADGRRSLGTVRFDKATFNQALDLDETTFVGPVSFIDATCSADVRFGNAIFEREARFDGASFAGQAWLVAARFHGPVSFSRTTFSGPAWFPTTVFAAGASFEGVRFERQATFASAAFLAFASFSQARFASHATFDKATFAAGCRWTDAQFSQGQRPPTADAGTTPSWPAPAEPPSVPPTRAPIPAAAMKMSPDRVWFRFRTLSPVVAIIAFMGTLAYILFR